MKSAQSPRRPRVRPDGTVDGLDLSLEEYFAAVALLGVLASQSHEPDHVWACRWAWTMADHMMDEARKRRRGKKRQA
jgi:hypothetical protein